MMRLQVIFVLLLLAASIETSLVWRNLDAARDGDASARVLVFTLAVVAAASIALLGRIVAKVKSARQWMGGRPQ